MANSKNEVTLGQVAAAKRGNDEGTVKWSVWKELADEYTGTHLLNCKILSNAENAFQNMPSNTLSERLWANKVEKLRERSVQPA